MLVDTSCGYREFQTAEEAEEWADTHYADLLSMNPEDELYRIISYYTGSWYKCLNELLRVCPPLDSPAFERINFAEREDEKQEILKINSVLNRYSLPENIIVYRYTHLRDLIKMTCKYIPRNGLCFSDKAFVSTTLVKGLLEQFSRENRCTCVLKICLPKGMSGAYVSFKTDKTLLNEQEFLLPPNIKMKITKIHCFTWPIQIDCLALLDKRGNIQ